MHYYEVRVAGRSYHSKKPLTYRSEQLIGPGSIVTIPVRNRALTGFIMSEVSEPKFATKEIGRIASGPPLTPEALQLHDWMQEYYPSQASATLQLFLPSSILKKAKQIDIVEDTTTETLKNPPLLRSSQTLVLKELANPQNKTVLLHGETGSGKTRVYAEQASKIIDSGKSVLILTPEIGLTSQLVRQLQSLLDTPIVTLHSQLTIKEKRERWEYIASSTTPLIIVGARSALFAPFKDLGLVVVDEFHEDAYKQEQAPHYHATRVAAQLASIHKAQLILGSATPPIADYDIFVRKKLPILEMSNPSDGEVEFSVIDIKDRNNFTSSPYLSKQLIAQITNTLERGEQVMVYLNRRGTARLILCQSCGWESICPNCDIPLTFHDDSHELRCHTCGRHEPPPRACPTCISADIFYKQIGTKSLVTHVQKLFPDAKVARFDTDLSKDQRLEAKFEDVQSGAIDILVGTQLLGKGLDLPKLSTIGIVQADSSLVLPDFSAREKTYQQLHQIIGRVGRGHRKGHVVIQTYAPESNLIASAIKKDYHSFYAQEIAERQQYLYPPFCYMLQITSSKKQSNLAANNAQAVVNIISSLPVAVSILGPTPAFKAKTHGTYHWQLIIKSKQRSDLLQIIEALPKGMSFNIDPINLL